MLARSLLATALLVAAPLAAEPAAGPPPADETRPDEAGLRATAHHWDLAEADRDVAYLSQLLAPEFRSVGVTGEVTSRAALLEQAARLQRSADARARRRADSAAFVKAHPSAVAVTIHGTVGIVSYYNPARGEAHSIRGADVFVYEARRWHAVHAMHNAAE